jgi:glycosyltransferase involved in cell wall biosynthesis
MRVLQINTTANSASHGRIAAGIGLQLLQEGHSSYIAYGRTGRECGSVLIKTGNRVDHGLHYLKSRLLDRHGFGSKYATINLVRKIQEIQPDIIHLHNIHGYFLNVAVLFRYLKKTHIPVVWTFHDTWPITGHCSYFEHMNCYKWRDGCFNCPNIKGYPESWFIDGSRRNYNEKKELFNGVENMVLVSPSKWLAAYLRQSFLSGYDIKVINNGVDTESFSPVDDTIARDRYSLTRKYILGVANIWDSRKGLKDFIRLRTLLDRSIDIVLVGLTRSQIESLDNGIIGISRTDSVEDLASLYSGAEVFVNPTYLDNFPLVNIEALACGTPVITYETGGSHESIDPLSGIAVEKGNIGDLHAAILSVINNEERYGPLICRQRAIELYSSGSRYREYIDLYTDRISKIGRMILHHGE